jgi:ribonucleoside-diphosphate reductase alpha chain
LLACFVTKSPEDSWIGMCENIANFGHIARRGGGCGVDFSQIRPSGDRVFGSTHYKACGPVRHMIVVSEAMNSITQAGFRGMANMGVLRVDHPDIHTFITCKQREFALKYQLKEDFFNHFDKLNGHTHEHANIMLDKFISNFNISVLITDEFMQAVEKDGLFDLRFGGEVYESIKAHDVFDLIVANSWNNGDPGILFYNAINNGPYKHSGQELTATNPCGEQMLPQWGSCNLGSIDVSKYYIPDFDDVNWNELRDDIRASFQFLDNVIDKNQFPTEEFKQWAQDNRPVGLGIMGWADLLLKKHMAYGEEPSIVYAEKMSKFFKDVTHEKSVELAEERGTPKSCKYRELDYRRNATTLSLAPTGSIAIIAGCSSSAEPIYAPTTYRSDNTGNYKMSHPQADEMYFRCAIDKDRDGAREVDWKQHVDMQAAFQKNVDSGISKTINMPNNATKKNIAEAYFRAWKKGCKGITIYRDECKTSQVLTSDDKTNTNYGANLSRPRPRTVACDIYRTTAEGMQWHIIVGLENNQPYEIFAVNGGYENLPSQGQVMKRKKRHYSLLDESGEILIDNLNIVEEEIDPRLGLETRRFSLELRHGILPKYIVQQIDKSSDKLTSFSKAVGRILKKHYLTVDEILAVSEDRYCEKCAKKGKKTEMQSDAACLKCPVCLHSRCG